MLRSQICSASTMFATALPRVAPPLENVPKNVSPACDWPMGGAGDQMERSDTDHHRWMLAHSKGRKGETRYHKIFRYGDLEKVEISKLFCAKYVCHRVAPRCSPTRKHSGKCFSVT